MNNIDNDKGSPKLLQQLSFPSGRLLSLYVAAMAITTIIGLVLWVSFDVGVPISRWIIGALSVFGLLWTVNIIRNDRSNNSDDESR